MLGPQPRGLDRRRFLHLAAGTALAGAGALGAEPARERPNILWLTCEDISPDLGCYGDDYAVTPHLDAFAKQGVLYTNAFGVTGVCAPNRSCLITGVYPSTLGSHGMRSRTALPNHIHCFSEYLRKAGYYCTNNRKTDYNFPVPRGAWDESSGKAHYRKRKPGQPFFAVFNFTITHESQIRAPEPRYQRNTRRLTPDQRHDPAEAPVPPFHPDTPEVRKDWARYYDNITALDYWVTDHLKALDDAGLADDTIVFFYSDHGAGMPGCKKWVWDSGLHVPLIIRFPKKWAKWAPGQPGTRTDRLVSFVDFAPTVLSLAGVEIPKHMQGSAFLGDQAAEPRRYVYAIRDRMAERYDTVRVVRDQRYQYLRNFWRQVPWSQFISYTEQMPTMRAWRKLHEQGKLTGPPARYFQAKPVEELYDNETDPHQIHNLAADPAHKAILDRMRAECYAWMRRTHDLGLLPEYEMHRRAEGRTRWDVAHDPEANPVGRLIQAAGLANATDPANIPKLLKLLGADHPAIRWWGAVGLAALGEKAAPATDALLKATEDPAPNVRIAAADALGSLDRLDDVFPVLLAGLLDDSPFIRLRALNAIDRLGDRSRPMLPAIQAAAMRGGGHVAGYVGRIAGYLSRQFKE
ncbi:MAG: sulfatase-like hydrolase/transferase [Planctomycetota bacterium]